MNLKTLNITLTFIALIPATTLLFYDIIGIVAIVYNFDPSTIWFLIPMVICLFGYAGLLMNLFWSKSIKFETYTLVFILLGLLGFSLFASFTDGFDRWKWLLSFENLKEWLLFGLPYWVSVVLVFIKAKYLVDLKKLN